MTRSEWLVHPNRSELGPDKPGRNGHFRPIRDRAPPADRDMCSAYSAAAHDVASRGPPMAR